MISPRTLPRLMFLMGAGWPLLTGLCVQAADQPAGPPPLYALIVGGGPDTESNAAQIEGHARFVASILPGGAKRIVLFADGKTDGVTVSYADPSQDAENERALDILLADHDADEPRLTRAPKLDVPVDGPAEALDVRRFLDKLAGQAAAAKPPVPLLLYFAGHGSQDEAKEQNTAYDLWKDEPLPVHALADSLAKVPKTVPVVLVMAQCFSGAFADLLFAHGEPEGASTGQDLVGFFSAHKDREAAGCSYATSRADYQDFSSFFFGALAGRDRFGEAVGGADYDGDGTVSLHEAFCYALIHDASGDTPVCTSGAFLHRFAFQPDKVVFSAPYPEVSKAASPAQRAVLDALSRQWGLEGDARALAVFDRLTFGDPAASAALVQRQIDAKAKLRVIRDSALEPLLTRWPGLRWGKEDEAGHDKASEGAADALGENPALRTGLLEAGKAQEEADAAVENEEAALMRFADVYEQVVEARELRTHGKAEVREQFERLWKAEGRVLPLATPAAPKPR